MRPAFYVATVLLMIGLLLVSPQYAASAVGDLSASDPVTATVTTEWRGAIFPLSHITGTFSMVAISDERAYTGANRRGLEVWDVLNLNRPTLLGAYGYGSTFWGLVAHNGWAYLAGTERDWIHSFNATDPAHIALGAAVGYSPKSMTVTEWRGRTYLVVQSSCCFYPRDNPWNGVSLYDITDGDPVGVDSYYLEGVRRNAQPVLIGNALYVNFDGVYVFDLAATGPLMPAAVLPWTAGWLATDGRQLYAGSGNGWRVFDVSQPLSPVLLATHSATFGSIKPVFATGLAYMLESYVQGKNRVHVLDLTDPARPREVARYNLPGDTSGEAWDLAAEDGRIYVAGGSTGLWLLRYIPGAVWLPMIGR